jgi:hypothetical protein
MTGEV